MFVSVFMGPASLTATQDGPLIDQCLDLSERSAASGFAMVTFGEQHFNNYEPYSNPFLMAARLSPVLGETWFGTTIVPLPLANVLRLAEESSVVDLLTRGRLLLGMSAGRVGPLPEWETFDVEMSRRQEAFDTKLDLLLQVYRRKAGDPPLDLNTDFDRGRLTGRMMPVPYRDGGPQLAIGTNTDATIEDVAQRGLALFLGPCPLPVVVQKQALHRSALERHGFAHTHIADVTQKSMVTRYVIVAPSEDEAWDAAETMCGSAPFMDRSVDKRPLREMAQVPAHALAADAYPRNASFVSGWMTVGTPDAVTEQLLTYTEHGVPHVNTRFTVGSYNPTLVERSFGLFTREVMPALKPEMFAAPAGDEISAEHRPGADVMALPTTPAVPPAAPPMPALPAVPRR